MFFPRTSVIVTFVVTAVLSSPSDTIDSLVHELGSEYGQTPCCSGFPSVSPAIWREKLELCQLKPKAEPVNREGTTPTLSRLRSSARAVLQGVGRAGVKPRHGLGCY